MAGPPLTPLLAFLDPATAPVDGKSARDRLAFVAQFSRLVRFYGIDNRPAGTWAPFMVKDGAILLAAIAATDYRVLDSQVRGLANPRAGAEETGRMRATALLRLLRHMVSTLAHWLTALEQQPPDFPLRGFLAREVAHRLVPGLSALAWETEEDWRWYRSLGRPWQGGAAQPRPDPAAPVAARLAALIPVCQAALDLVVQTVDAAAQQYPIVAAQPTPHPDTALMRVFVDLMEHHQAILNGIGKRHLDFYYRTVLQMAPRPARADTVVVLAATKPDQPIVTVPAGTGFAAGKDGAGKAVVFANPETAVVNSGTVTAAFSLKSDTGGRVFRPGIHTDTLTGLGTVQRDAAGNSLARPVFGTPSAAPAGLGFVVASPLLLLEGGSRSITLTLEMPGTPPPLPDGWSGGWRSWVTTASGWVDAGAYALPPHYTPPADGKPGNLLLEWMLPADAPPLQPPDKPVDGRACAWPQMKLRLPPGASAIAWPRIAAVTVDVAVRGLTQLTLWSSQAPLTEAAPYPLGPVPQPGSRFLVGSREIFAKPVGRLGLTLNWLTPPQGLGERYREYNMWQAAQHLDLPPLDETRPRGSWHWREPEGWKQAGVTARAGQPPDALFQGGTSSVFTIQMQGQRPQPALARSPTLADPAQAAGGYLAFTLEGPPQGFGHQIYPQVLAWVGQMQAQALMQAAEGKAPTMIPIGTPNPPFTPTLKSASVDYTAGCRHVPGADAGAIDPPSPLEWYHEGPWHSWLAWASGRPLPRQAPLAPGPAEAGLTLVPRVAPEGCLFLAVGGLPAPCSLKLFAAVADHGEDADGQTGAVDVWRYGRSGWTAVDVLGDETGGLNATGMMELFVAEGGGGLPVTPALAACTWLAVTPRGSWRPLSLTLLGAQPLRLVRQDVAPDTPDLPPIPAGTIVKAPLPALAGVSQPLASTGGRAAETDQGFTGDRSFHRRVAQRLAHKGRIVSERDLVLLAHDLMPDLFHAEVLPAAKGPPGSIRLGVVPRIAAPTAPGAFQPRVDPATRSALAAQLQDCAPATARISVHSMAPAAVTISAGLVLSREAVASWPLLRKDWILALRLYLSPWIAGAQPRYDLRTGLTRADILRRIAAFPGVLAIESFGIDMTTADGTVREYTDASVTAPPGQLLVSADDHRLTLAEG